MTHSKENTLRYRKITTNLKVNTKRKMSSWNNSVNVSSDVMRYNSQLKNFLQISQLHFTDVIKSYEAGITTDSPIDYIVFENR